ncbi:hypothetical protein ACFXK0_19240 [Nocardia sp. NPDC059177]|uniref:hypothetical protein n=1 Tax=Nocardia sp. NPDC059177 TaxID=3346759 RepID=UPI0036C34672
MSSAPGDSATSTTPAAADTGTGEQAAEQFFEHSGVGPVMDDAPASAEQTFTYEGTGPVMDAAESPAAPADEQFFQHSGTGPVMDDFPATAPRQ